MDPRIRIHTKISWIRSTACLFALRSLCIIVQAGAPGESSAVSAQLLPALPAQRGAEHRPGAPGGARAPQHRAPPPPPPLRPRPLCSGPGDRHHGPQPGPGNQGAGSRHLGPGPSPLLTRRRGSDQGGNHADMKSARKEMPTFTFNGANGILGRNWTENGGSFYFKDLFGYVLVLNS